MVDIEEVKIIAHKKPWKLLMLSMPKALQLEGRTPLGAPYVISECLVLASFE